MPLPTPAVAPSTPSSAAAIAVQISEGPQLAHRDASHQELGQLRPPLHRAGFLIMLIHPRIHGHAGDNTILLTGLAMTLLAMQRSSKPPRQPRRDGRFLAASAVQPLLASRRTRDPNEEKNGD